ncbi:nucleotide-binding universal stress UspA family protein [Motilibacter rhizosphaerae]|uniref:Nucleotide-binding universal stress UspA family protein n=1 Tax=Motilibacter rhizosphaerae TaxID=598652 RepID=A0A4Q7NBJ9_9ACTN|nr:universal stress protein [Motilibacter rhizosphaerae]RZS79997.1 nucleotide-binding universal stress UspA family protein [Motilibacter rhizosphaerae]
MAAHVIVVGTDGSHPAGAALSWAAEQARATGAQLRVVHAWTVPIPVGYGFGPEILPPEAAEQTGGMEEDAERVRAAVLAALEGSEGLDVDVRVRQGHPAQVLLDEAGDADLVVVGRRGTGGFAAAVMGSVSRYVSAHAHCPVVVVPHEQQVRSR